MSSPYQCPRHNVALVARVLAISKRGRVARYGIRYFACPIAGCDFMKPDKWVKRKRYDKEN